MVCIWFVNKLTFGRRNFLTDDVPRGITFANELWEDFVRWNFYDFLSLNEVVGDLRIHVHLSVCASVRTSVTRLLENRSLLFSETLQLVNACISKTKMFQALFWKKFPFCPFWPKTVQNWPFWPKMTKNVGFPHFFAIHSLEFANFLY